ncbi:MAG TPA: DUF1003 domain-containing protein [Acidimicrobiales bacterium]|nr:DUF1003 domain-containing protein [Acidimicrobiales bacterium]
MSTLHTDVNGLDSRYEPHADQHSPIVLYHLKKRADDWQLHLADRVTTFAGSMTFVWVHVAIFAFWVASGLFGADRYPFQFLTFIVSLEAIFLSTFVMIGQNRQSAFQQAKADHDFHAAETELKLNTDLTRAVHTMTQEIQALLEEVRHKVGEGSPPGTAGPAAAPRA